MCKHQYLVYSPYLKRPIYVDCGKCKSCLQKKADKRAQRIRNTYHDGLTCIMASLTYSRNTAPYILRSDAFKFCKAHIPSINVYRDCSVRKVRKVTDHSDYSQVYRFDKNRVILQQVDFIKESSLKDTKDLKHEYDKIGVCYYPDYQHFIARLRLNLKRHYNYEKQFFVYACSEYGSSSQRPHFHMLVFCDKSDKEILMSAIYESWPFSDLRRWPKSVQEVTRAADYVASYVNSGSKFPKFFKTYFKMAHSYSKGFGLGNRFFSLTEILRLFERGSFRYGVVTTKNGISSVINVPLPSYVIHRYFPKFKGYTRLSPSSLVENLRRIGHGDYEDFCKHSGVVYLSQDEFNAIATRLHNAQHRFYQDCPDSYKSFGFEDYYRLHKSIWNTYNSTLLRFQMENTDVPLEEHFDNLDEFFADGVPERMYLRGRELLRLNGINPDSIKETHINRFFSVVKAADDKEQRFYRHIKHRNINAVVRDSDDPENEL